MLRTTDGRDGQMHMVKLIAAVGALTLSSLALADTHFECGTIACSAFGSGVITAIDDVVVGSEHFNVTFSNTQDTTFAFSSFPAASGQPLTGIDAGNALDAFYATQKGPIPQDDGPGILAQVGGVNEEVFNIVTAFASTSTPGVVNIDITEPFLGISLPAGTGVSAQQVSSGFPCSSFAACTVWTPIAAPEISLVSAPSELTFLLGCLVMLRGRRPGQRAA
jgi:hypothetical protein